MTEVGESKAAWWKRCQVLSSAADGAWLELALRSLMSSSTKAGSPSERNDEIASAAEPRLTLRITGASDLLAVCGVLLVYALVLWAGVPSGTLAAVAGAGLSSSGGDGRSLFSLASIDSVTEWS